MSNVGYQRCVYGVFYMLHCGLYSLHLSLPPPPPPPCTTRLPATCAYCLVPFDTNINGMEMIRNMYGRERLIELGEFRHGNLYKNMFLSGGEDCADGMNTALGANYPCMLTNEVVGKLKKTQTITVSLEFVQDAQLNMPFTVGVDLTVTAIVAGTDLAASEFLSSGDVIVEVNRFPATVVNLNHAFSNQADDSVCLLIQIVRSAANFNELLFFDEAGRWCGWVVRGGVRACAAESPLDLALD